MTGVQTCALPIYKSYGIHVAKLAGLPLPTLKRAQDMLQKLEKKGGKPPVSPSKTAKEQQLSLFSPYHDDPQIQAFSDELKKLDTDHLTPWEALQKLHQWKRMLK